MGNWNSHNLCVRVRFQCFGHAKSTSCSQLERFCAKIYPHASFKSFTLDTSFEDSSEQQVTLLAVTNAISVPE